MNKPIRKATLPKIDWRRCVSLACFVGSAVGNRVLLSVFCRRSYYEYENNLVCDAVGFIRWERAGEKKARLYIPAIGALLGAPAFFMVVASPSFYASMFFLFVE